MLSDPKKLKGIHRELMDVKKGRVRSWNEFEKELKKRRVNFSQMRYEVGVTKHFERLLRKFDPETIRFAMLYQGEGAMQPDLEPS